MTQPQTQHKTYFDPHGYFFVCLPDSVYQRRLQKFDEPLTDELIPARGPSSNPDLLSGMLTCRLVCITPVHIGSGSYRHDPDVPGNVTVDIVCNPQGNPLIPGSSLKGSFRAIAEAATKSCLLLRQTQHGEQRRELPDAVVNQLRQEASRTSKRLPSSVAVRVKTDSFEPCQVPFSEQERQEQGIQLCPCCSVFGALLYRGRINFSDAVPIGQHYSQSNMDIADFVCIPSRYGGRAHRLAPSGGLRVMEMGEEVGLEIRRPLGRRFYPNWDPYGLFFTGEFDWTSIDAHLPNRTVLNQSLFNSRVSHQVQWQRNRFIRTPCGDSDWQHPSVSVALYCSSRA